MGDSKPDKRFKKQLNKVNSVLYTAQTGAFLYTAGRYAVLPSNKAGESIDNAIESFYSMADDLVKITENLAASANDLAIKAGLGFRESRSRMESLALIIEQDIDSELTENTQNTADLHAQKQLLSEYRSQLEQYELIVNQNISHFIDMKHHLINIRMGIAKPAEKAKESSGLIRRLLEFKERGLNIAGSSSEARYKDNFTALNAAYIHASQNQATADRALFRLGETYRRQVEYPDSNKHELRQEYLSRSISILQNSIRSSSLKETLENSNLNIDLDSEQKEFTEELSSIVQQNQGIRCELKSMGYDTSSEGCFFQYALPVAAALGCIMVYSQFLKIEKKAIAFFKDCFSRTKKE
jgi:hypothetical protein